MKGRIFIALMGLAFVFASNLYADGSRIFFEQGGQNYLGLPIQTKGGITVDFGDITLSNNSGSAGNQKLIEIDCRYQHGLVQIAQAALPFYQTYAALDIYRREIDKEQTVELAKWQGYFDIEGIYAGAYASAYSEYPFLFAMNQGGGSGMMGGLYGGNPYQYAGASQAAWNYWGGNMGSFYGWGNQGYYGGTGYHGNTGSYYGNTGGRY